MSRKILLIFMLGFSGCAAATPTSTIQTEPSVPPPTLTNTVQPTSTQIVASPDPGPTLPAPSPTAPATAAPATAAFSDPTLGVSFSYPGNWAILQRAPESTAGVSLHGPPLGEGPEPIIFAISVEVAPASEKSVDKIVDEQLGQVPSDLNAGVETRVLSVGGERAIEVIGLPSRSGALETFILHKDRLYAVILQPFDQDNPSLWPYLADARATYLRLLQSLRFVN